jgi:glycosyltransferase involved in cell wall biosynthesis
MRIRLIGQANDSGIGTHFGNYLNALKSISAISPRVELLDHNDQTRLKKSAADSVETDINIAFVNANLNDHFRGVNINWTVFESTRIPTKLYGVMNSHLLWVPSEWGRKIAIGQGINYKQINVVPEGVDINIFHPYLIPENKKFRFLLIGKYESRKSINESIDAFATVFKNNPQVELIIKSDFFVSQELKIKELVDKIKNTHSDNIKLIWGYQTPTELVNLYRNAHVFLFPTKAEGWGLPLIEAAATGLPIITTFHSGQTEFLQHIRSSCVLLNYSLDPISCPEYRAFYHEVDGNYGKWAVTTVDEISRGIKEAYNKYSTLRTQAIKNSGIIRSKYSWANCANTSLDVLKAMGVI